LVIRGLIAVDLGAIKVIWCFHTVNMSAAATALWISRFLSAVYKDDLAGAARKRTVVYVVWNTVIIRVHVIPIASIANAVVVRVGLVRIGSVRAVVTTVGNAIIIGVCRRV
jgi:hypothetical protein